MTLSIDDYVRIASEGNPLERLTNEFAPQIVGMERAKQAVILALASDQDTRGTRQRIHVLLTGKSGVGKTEVLRAACNETGNILYGPRMSAGGITVDFRTGKVGIIADVNATPYQLLALDEIEKFDDSTLEHLLTSMETGSFTYAGGGHTGTIPAHVRVIAAANNTEKLSAELLDRFDYIINIPQPNRAQAHRVVHGITNTYLQETTDPNENEYDSTPQPGFVREYLDLIQLHKPTFPTTERRLAEIIFRMLIDNENEDEIRLRPYKGILRTAHALARIHNTDLTAEMILKSVELLHPDWQPAQLENIRELLAFRREQQHAQAQQTTPEITESPETELNL